MKRFCLHCFILLWLSVANAQTIITNTLAYPYPYICKVKKYAGGKVFVATGTIISRSSILTNAHVVKGADSLLLFPGLNDEEQPFGPIRIVCKRDSNVFYPAEFDTSFCYQAFDYAIVRFTDEATYQRIYKQALEREFTLSSIFYYPLGPLFIAGYPVYHWWEFKRRSGKLLIQNSTSNAKIAVPFLRYELDTRAGNSGSPLWVRNQGNLSIVGIHKTGQGQKDEGLLFTPGILKRIHSWVDQ